MTEHTRRRGWTLTWVVGLSLATALLTLFAAALGYGGDQLHQRALQDQFEELPGCAVRSQRWVRDTLLENLWPGNYEEALPDDGIGVGFNEEATPAGLALAQRLRNVFGVSLNNCALESYWPWILARTDLEDLGFADVAITDAHLAQLAGHKQIDDLKIRNAPITDASLATIAKFPIEFLELQDTEVTLAGIEAFAAAHPQVRIKWIAPLSEELRSIQATLAERQIVIGPRYPNEGIRDFGWRVSFQLGCKPTDEDFALLAMLPGPIEYVGIWEPLDDATLQQIRALPGVLHVRLFARTSVYENILILSDATTINQFEFSFDAVTPEQLEMLRKKLPGKITNWN